MFGGGFVPSVLENCVGWNFGFFILAKIKKPNTNKAFWGSSEWVLQSHDIDTQIFGKMLRYQW